MAARQLPAEFKEFIKYLNRNKVRYLNKALGIDFERCYKRKQIVKLDGILVQVISRQDLIKSKMAANREKDLANIRELKRVSARTPKKKNPQR